MTTLLILGFGASFTGFTASVYLMYRLLSSKRQKVKPF